MGNSQHKQLAQNFPKQGCRVVQVLATDLESKLQPFTDFIVKPSPQQLKKCSNEVTLQIFSILDYSLRTETIPISNNHFGARIRVTKVTDCALKVTKVFPHSPCQKLGILVDQYIVGLLQSDFDSLSSFAQSLHQLIAESRELITLGVCNRQGVTRLVPTPVVLIKERRGKNQGMLGCELAQGWMHRFKLKPRRSQIPKTEAVEQQTQSIPKKDEQVLPKTIQPQKQVKDSDEQEQNEMERKLGGQRAGECVEINFKGLLKNEYLQDASTICRCKIYDKSCERCWLERDGSYYFFNRKTNRIIAIPSALLLTVPL